MRKRCSKLTAKSGENHPEKRKNEMEILPSRRFSVIFANVYGTNYAFSYRRIAATASKPTTMGSDVLKLCKTYYLLK
jgi:hypothetical protein